MTDGPLVGQGRRPASSRPWPELPPWFRRGVVAAGVLFVGVVVVAIVLSVSFKDQPLYERRTAPAQGQSHHVGDFQFSALPPQPVTCGAVAGLRIAGTTSELDLLTQALGGVCKYLKEMPDGTTLATRIVVAARRGTVISFGVFRSTGDDTTTITGPPVRLLVNNRFADNVFKGFLAPVLAHELWHAGGPSVTAEEEYAARRIETQVCDKILTANTTSRSCRDARQIVDAGEQTSVAELRKVGYP